MYWDENTDSLIPVVGAKVTMYDADELLGVEFGTQMGDFGWTDGDGRFNLERVGEDFDLCLPGMIIVGNQCCDPIRFKKMLVSLVIEIVEVSQPML